MCCTDTNSKVQKCRHKKRRQNRPKHIDRHEDNNTATTQVQYLTVKRSWKKVSFEHGVGSSALNQFFGLASVKSRAQ